MSDNYNNMDKVHPKMLFLVSLSRCGLSCMMFGYLSGFAEAVGIRLLYMLLLKNFYSSPSGRKYMLQRKDAISFEDRRWRFAFSEHVSPCLCSYSAVQSCRTLQSTRDNVGATCSQYPNTHNDPCTIDQSITGQS